MYKWETVLRQPSVVCVCPVPEYQYCRQGASHEPCSEFIRDSNAQEARRASYVQAIFARVSLIGARANFDSTFWAHLMDFPLD